MATVSRRQVPVVLVAGFLGAGKTTLLNHLLSNESDLRLGVVVNDFGAVPIDQTLVTGQVDSTVALGNGCLCCAVDASGLDAMLERLVDPALELDGIVVEASGIAEPRTLIRMLDASALPELVWGGCVYLVDAAEFEATAAEHPRLTSHLAVADLVVLNKADTATSAQIASLREQIAQAAPRAAVTVTTEAAVDPRLLFDLPDRPLPLQPTLPFGTDPDEELGGGHHLHDDFDSVSFTTPQPLHPRAVTQFLREPPIGAYRIKGHTQLAGDRRPVVVQSVGGRIRLSRAPRSELDGSTALVVIGAGLDRDDVLHRLASCVHDPTTNDPEPTEADLRTALRHLR